MRYKSTADAPFVPHEDQELEMNVATLDMLRIRIENLERENAAQRTAINDVQRRYTRSLRIAGSVLVMLAVGLLIGAAQPSDDPAVVEADQFVVRDAEGTVRARFGLNSRAGSVLSLADTNGEGRIDLHVPANGFPQVDVSHKDVGHLMLNIRSDGVMAVDFLNKERQGQIALKVEDGTQYLSFLSQDGVGRVNLGLNDSGSGGVAVGRGLRQIEMLVAGDDDPRIVVSDADGQRLFQAP